MHQLVAARALWKSNKIKTTSNKSLSETCPSMLKRLGKVFSSESLLLVTLNSKLHLMTDPSRGSEKKGAWILGITFFTTLWILYMARCALNAAAENDRTQTRARAQVQDPLELLPVVRRTLQNQNTFCVHACKVYV